MDKLIYAGFWLRLVAFLIDCMILFIPAYLLRLVAPYIGLTGTALEIVDFIYVLVLWGLYYGFTESSIHQATFGKRIMKLRVVSYSNNRITFINAVGRFLGQFPSFLLMGVGVCMIAFTSKKQGLHDMLAKCLVIRV